MIIQGLQNELLINIDAVAATAERNQPFGNAPFINFVIVYKPIAEEQPSKRGEKIQGIGHRNMRNLLNYSYLPPPFLL